MKQQLTKTIGLMTFLFCLLTIATGINAQTPEPEWKLLQERDSVKIYYAASLCGDLYELCLKAENSSSSFAYTHLALEITDDSLKQVVAPVMIDVPANKTLIINCENRAPHQMPSPVVIQNPAAFTCTVLELEEETVDKQP